MKYKCCLGNCRKAAHWKSAEFTEEDFISRLEEPIRTNETVEEYHALPRTEKDKIKDKGGFMPGVLKGTRRKADEVLSRSMLTLDLDKLSPDFIETYSYLGVYRTLLYTTHSHTLENPRARVLVFLTRDVTPKEYNAIVRLFAAEIGIEMVDPCSFSINQLMYWPSAPKDGEYIFKDYAGEVLDPDKFLSSYPGWEDSSSLPTTPEEKKVRAAGSKQEDPLGKVGTVGDFCRAYTIMYKEKDR